MSTGKRIKEIRKKLNLNQVEFSESIGISQSAISQAEKEVISISADVLRNIMTVYNININWLLNGEGNMFNIADFNLDEHITKMKEKAHKIHNDKQSHIKELANRLVTAIKELDLEEYTICERIFESMPKLKDYEEGREEIPAFFMDKFCKKFKVSREWFEFGSGEMLTEKPHIVTPREEWDWKIDKDESDATSANRLAEMLNVPIRFKPETSSISEESHYYNSSGYISVPVSAEISAGEPLKAIESEPLTHIEVSSNMIPNPKNIFCFKVNGNSMHPMIDHNDYVIINKVYDSNNLDGKIVAVRNDEGITLKMMKINHKKKLSVLFPVNKKFEPIFLDESHIIIGTLSLLYRRFE